MATWAMRKRWEWITARVAAGESFVREDLVSEFTITKQTATATLHRYREEYPGAIVYDGTRRAFVRAGTETKTRLAALRISLIEQAERSIATGGREEVDPTDVLEFFGIQPWSPAGLPALGNDPRGEQVGRAPPSPPDAATAPGGLQPSNPEPQS